MRKIGCLAFVLALLAALGGVLDVFAKSFSEQQVAAAIEHQSKGHVAHSSASISSFPYVGRLLANGTVDHIDIVMTGVTGTPQPIDELDVHIDGLQMDRDALLGEHHVQIKGVDRVTVSVLISAVRVQSVADAFGVQLSFEKDAVRINGQRLEVGVAKGALTIRGAGLAAMSVAIPAGDAQVLPCQPDATVTSEGVRLSCTADHVPGVLLDAIGSPRLRAVIG